MTTKELRARFEDAMSTDTILDWVLSAGVLPRPPCPHRYDLGDGEWVECILALTEAEPGTVAVRGTVTATSLPTLAEGALALVEWFERHQGEEP